jgi:hypothetical protein
MITDVRQMMGRKNLLQRMHPSVHRIGCRRQEGPHLGSSHLRISRCVDSTFNVPCSSSLLSSNGVHRLAQARQIHEWSQGGGVAGRGRRSWKKCSKSCMSMGHGELMLHIMW